MFPYKEHLAQFAREFVNQVEANQGEYRICGIDHTFAAVFNYDEIDLLKAMVNILVSTGTFFYLTARWINLQGQVEEPIGQFNSLVATSAILALTGEYDDIVGRYEF